MNDLFDKKNEHPGGKLRREGQKLCSDKEILTIIIGTGIKGKSAEKIAEELLYKYNSVFGLMGKTLGELMEIKGINLRKATRIAASYELARRMYYKMVHNW